MNRFTDSIPARFAAVVAAWPDAVAIEDERRVRYAELAQRAGVVAARLPGIDAGPGLVAILAEDRATAIVAMLGTAHSGHAYVPLDAGDPESRLRLIVEDAAPCTIVADPAQADRARALAKGLCPVLVLDGEALESAARGSPSPATPDSLLFVQYTSGSSGRPKGVRQTHRNVIFYADAYATTLDIQRDDRLSLLYTLSFSASNMDIYGGLLRGATLCPRDLRREGVTGLADWLAEREITVLHTVPTVLRELTRAAEVGRTFPRLRAVDLGGEAVFAEDIRRFRTHVAGNCLFVNHLAATEISVISQFVFLADDLLPDGALPAGRSPQAVVVTILADDGDRARPGETGRIAIDSPYLSPGYWRRPEMDMAFTELPARPGWRRFLTEDRGRIDADGLLHFMGRDGARAKIHGHTVDLHEIEAALLACEAVSEAAVVAGTAEKAADESLVACIVPVPGASATPDVLRRQLARRLPGYMLPSAYVFMPELPRTGTGKIDRRGLADVDLVSRRYRPGYRPPEDEYELRVATLFAQILQCERVGRADDFFLLGGDSLRAVELQLALRVTFGRDLPDFAEHSTVARCAARLRAIVPGAAASLPRLVPLRAAGRRPPLHLVHGRLGQAFISPRFAALFDDEQPLFAIQARGLDGLVTPARTIEEMAADYVAAIRAHQPEGPYLLAALCAGSYVAMAMADALAALGSQVLPLLLFDPPEPWSSAPVGRSQVERQIRLRHDQNRIAAPIGDPRLLRAAVDVARAFERAVRRHAPSPFQRGAFVLMSRRRLREQWTAPLLSRVLGDAIECIVVGEEHADVLDPENAEFAAAVRRCMTRIHDGLGPENNLHLIDAPDESLVLRCRRGWRRFRRRYGV